MNWFFNRYARWRMKKLKGLDFKMDNITKRIKSDVLEDMKYEMKNFNKLEEIDRKLEVKKHKLETINVIRDYFGIEKTRSFPLFTENQIQEIKSQKRLYMFLLTLFVLSETLLYYLTAEIVVPMDNIFVKLVIGFMMAVLVFLLFDFFLKSHFVYREVIERKEELKYTEVHIKKYRDKLILGYTGLFIAIFFMISASVVRYYYLHGTDISGMNSDEIKKAETLGMWVNYLIIAFTIGIAVYLGPLKIELLKTINEYKVYKKWRQTIIRLNLFIQSAYKIISNHYSRLNHLMEINWQLVLGIREIFGIEFDPKYSAKFNEYKHLKKTLNFKMNKNIYESYNEVQCSDEDLFKFGILNDDYMLEWNDKIKIIKEHITKVDTNLKNISIENKK